MKNFSSRFFALSLMAIFLFSLRAFADLNRWSAIGPGGGQVTALVSTSPTEFYAGTATAGVWRGTVDGIGAVSWRNVNGTGEDSLGDIFNEKARRIQALKVSGGVIFVGTETDGVWRGAVRIDGTVAWSPLNGTGMSRLGGAPSGSAYNVRALEISGSTVYAGTSNGVWKGVLASSDGQVNAVWSPFNGSGVTALPASAGIKVLLLSGSVLFAGLNNTLPDGLGGGVWRGTISETDGVSDIQWRDFNGTSGGASLGLDGREPLARYVNDLALYEVEGLGEFLFVATNGAGVWTSYSDPPAAWGLLTSGPARLNNTDRVVVRSIKTLRTGPTTHLYAATEGVGIWKCNLSALGTTQITPWSAANGGSGAILGGRNGSSAFYGNVLSVNGAEVVAGTGAGVWKGTPQPSGDMNWSDWNGSATSPLLAHNVTSVATAGSRVYVGTDSGVWKGTRDSDDHYTWTEFNGSSTATTTTVLGGFVNTLGVPVSFLGGRQVKSIVFDGDDLGSDLYVATQNMGVWRGRITGSEDSESVSWSDFNGSSPSDSLNGDDNRFKPIVSSLTSSSSADGRVLYAGLIGIDSGTVWRRNLASGGWQSLWSSRHAVRSLNVALPNLYVGHDGGIRRVLLGTGATFDFNGESSTSLMAVGNLNALHVRSLLSEGGTLYAATEAGIFKGTVATAEDGVMSVQWTNGNGPGLSDYLDGTVRAKSSSLAYLRNRLYVGAMAGGVWKGDEAGGIRWSDANDGLPYVSVNYLGLSADRASILAGTGHSLFQFTPGAFCGNSLVESGETCDDGNTVTTDACPRCQRARCGDGFTRMDITDPTHPAYEQCDSGTNCDSQCRLIVGAGGISGSGSGGESGGSGGTSEEGTGGAPDGMATGGGAEPSTGGTSGDSGSGGDDAGTGGGAPGGIETGGVPGEESGIGGAEEGSAGDIGGPVGGGSGVSGAGGAGGAGGGDVNPGEGPGADGSSGGCSCHVTPEMY